MDNEKLSQSMRENLNEIKRKIHEVEEKMMHVTREAMATHPIYQRLEGQRDVLLSLYGELGRATDAHDAGQMMQGE